MSKVETACPYCRKWNVVEKSGASTTPRGYKIQCSHCSKYWEDSLGEAGSLAKSSPVPSAELSALIVQVRAQMEDLVKQIHSLIERRTAAPASARFNVNGREVEKSDEINRELLNKALANGKPVTFQKESSTPDRFKTVESVGSGQRMRSGAAFDINGVEKSDVADQELRHALANGSPLRFVPSGN